METWEGHPFKDILPEDIDLARGRFPNETEVVAFKLKGHEIYLDTLWDAGEDLRETIKHRVDSCADRLRKYVATGATH